jgi:HEAT repeat protein
MNQSEEHRNTDVPANVAAEPGEIQSLIRDLGEKDSGACRSAYQVLLKIGGQAVPALVEALTSPTDKVRWQAIKLLGAINIDWIPYVSERTIKALTTDLGSSNGFERQRARQALIRIGNKAVGTLIPLLSAKGEIKRWEAAKALSQIRDPSATEALIKALVDKNFDIRWLAAEGLISIGEPALVPLLRELTRNPESVWLREAAHHYLHSIKSEKLIPILSPVLGAVEEGEEAQLKVALVADSALNSLSNQ